MQIRSIVVNVENGRRVVIRPDGTFDLEYRDDTVAGWVIDNNAHVDQVCLEQLLWSAGAIATNVASQLREDNERSRKAMLATAH